MSGKALVALLLALYPAPAMAQMVTSGDVVINSIHASPADTDTARTNAVLMQKMPAGPTIELYGIFLNGGQMAEAVTQVTSPVASKAGIVRWVRGSQFTDDLPVDLPPGKKVVLGPDTEFLRLYGVNQAYRVGDKFPVTFHFRNAPDATVEVSVQ